jgi:hypothetical protein
MSNKSSDVFIKYNLIDELNIYDLEKSVYFDERSYDRDFYLFEDMKKNPHIDANVCKYKCEKKRVPDSFNRYTKQFRRSPLVRINALRIAAFRCEFDEAHCTFISKANPHLQYMETHHLIPVEFQQDFSYSVDVEENVVSLCSVCHACLHFGAADEMLPILDSLFFMRRELLTSVGLAISLNDLIKFYV